MTNLIKFFTEELHLNSSYALRFEELMTVRRLKQKEILITEDTVCNFLGIVIYGSLRSYLQNDGSEYNNEFFFKNDFVSAYASFLTRQPNVCNIQALSETELCCISYSDLNELIRQEPEWTILGKYVSDQFFLKKCNRESSFLKESAAERYESCLKHYPGIEQKVSQYHIASYLGIKPETLSRIKH